MAKPAPLQLRWLDSGLPTTVLVKELSSTLGGDEPRRLGWPSRLPVAALGALGLLPVRDLAQ